MLRSLGRRVPARSVISLVLVLIGLTPLAAEQPRLVAARFAEAPEIDGHLDDPAWGSAQPVEGFAQVAPSYGEASPFRTAVLVGYTADTLFVAFRCFDPEPPSKLSSAVLTRDGELENDDSVSVLLDPFNDRRTAYFFTTNLHGVQKDGKVADNGRTVDSKWDASWRSAASRTPEGWTAELAIPFEILKFPIGKRVWGINFHRYIPRRLEIAVWSGPEESEWRVSSFGALTGLELQSLTEKRFEIIPYGTFVAEEDQGYDWQVGGDLRYRIRSGLSADLTVNPDFALVEADVEKVNLTRFELFVPEKRPFFLEGLEMFSQRIRQFYSRRIGDINWGGKLTGKLAGWDLAALVTDTDLEISEAPVSTVRSVGADYSVLRAQKGVFGVSTIGFLAANRSLQGQNAGSIGLDTTLFFTETLGMTAQLIRAHGPENDGAMAWFLRPAFDSANTHFHVRYTNLDVGLLDNINAIGFLRDDDRKEIDSNIKHTFWFKDSWIEKIKGGVNYNRYQSQEGVLRSWELEGELEVVLSNHWYVELLLVEEYKLYEKEFRNSVTQIELGFDDRAGKSFDLVAGTGKNYDSDLDLAGFDLALNLSDKWNLWYEGTWLELDPDPEDDSTWIHVLGANYYFTNDLFVKLFFQTNSAIDKENIQALLVWRFLPPFGSLQVAFQRGTSAIGTQSEQGNSLFTKLSWVF
jgi:hypothetical protein